VVEEGFSLAFAEKLFLEFYPLTCFGFHVKKKPSIVLYHIQFVLVNYHEDMLGLGIDLDEKAMPLFLFVYFLFVCLFIKK
jgi:hypothetical protein